MFVDQKSLYGFAHLLIRMMRLDDDNDDDEDDDQ